MDVIGAGSASRVASDSRTYPERDLEAIRLAAISAAMNGLAHESRNALQRSQVSLELLAMELHDRPTAVNLIARIQLAQNDLHRLYEKVRDYASPLRLDLQRQAFSPIVHDAWNELESLRAGRVVQLRQECMADDPDCEVDRRAMTRVFNHLLRNALAACSDPVEIAISYQATDLRGQPALQIELQDNGPGFSAADRQNAFAPFFTTKTKGSGLGLATSKRIVEAHGGRIMLGSPAHKGTQFILILPRGKS